MLRSIPRSALRRAGSTPCPRRAGARVEFHDAPSFDARVEPFDRGVEFLDARGV